VKNGRTEKTLPHFHDSIEIAFMLKGKCLVHINAEERVLEAGEACFVAPFDPHFYHPEDGNEYYVVLVSSKYLGSENELDEKGFPAFSGVVQGFDEVKRLLDYVYGVWDKENEALKSGFVNLLVGVMKKYYPFQKRERGRDAEALVSALQYINERYAEEISLEQLAAKYGYSRNYFSALFNRFTGMNLREYINRRRISAYERLKGKDPTLPACKGAQLCGFVSLNTFYRALDRYGKEKQYRKF
jgi:AraC-like DNA-binding protein